MKVEGKTRPQCVVCMHSACRPTHACHGMWSTRMGAKGKDVFLDDSASHQHLRFFLKTVTEIVKKWIEWCFAKLAWFLSLFCYLRWWKKKSLCKSKILNAVWCTLSWVPSVWFIRNFFFNSRQEIIFHVPFLVSRTNSLQKWTFLFDFCVLQEVLISLMCCQQEVTKSWFWTVP